MEYRSGQIADFVNVETFVWQAIFPAFDHPELNEEQRAENDAIVADAKSLCLEAIALAQKEVFVAYDSRQKRMAGFIILDKSPYDYPEIVWLIVSRKYWGTGVSDGLIQKGLHWLGTEKPVKIAVHYYLERAMAFFKRYDFENTGEPAEDYLIPRILFLREAGPLKEPATEDPDQLELPIEADETPIHNPVEFTEEEMLEKPHADHPVETDAFPAEDLATSLENDNFFDSFSSIDELELDDDIDVDDVIQKIPLPDPPKIDPDYRSRYNDIEFEVDYGDEDPSIEDLIEETPPSGKLDFEFAFDEEEMVVETATDEELELPDLSNSETTIEEEIVTDEVAEDVEKPMADISKIRLRFQDYFMGKVTDLFGNKQAVNYFESLQVSDFQMIVDNSLKQLAKHEDWENRFDALAGDLTEYFVVETAADLHQHTFPQRLLRYQSRAIDTDEYFNLINDYLDLSSEKERVDTDFITISPKRLKNATKNFLLAGVDERVYYIVDQSILGNLKNGFAFTNKGFYWKALLQPNHVAYYSELEEVKIEKGSVKINGHFFDTGKSTFNLKIALLLKKLGRLN